MVVSNVSNKSSNLELIKNSPTDVDTAYTTHREIESIFLAQPVQYAGSMRTFFRADGGFDMRKVDGNIIINSPLKGMGRELEISFANISAVVWKVG
jgi:hypothetical protein